jgi:hypothetical protein
MSLGSDEGAGVGNNEVGEGLERSLDRSGTSLVSGFLCTVHMQKPVTRDRWGRAKVRKG